MPDDKDFLWDEYKADKKIKVLGIVAILAMATGPLIFLVAHIIYHYKQLK